MNIRFVSANTKERLAEIEALYLAAFPLNERKLFSMLSDKQAEGNVEILSAEDMLTKRMVGEVILAKYKDIIFLDYFAVLPKLRGRGAGSCILKSLQKRCYGKRLILEIESTKVSADNSSQRQMRKKFYEHNGMRCMDYSALVVGVEMEVLTFNCNVLFEEYQAVYENVYGKEIGSQILLLE